MRRFARCAAHSGDVLQSPFNCCLFSSLDGVAVLDPVETLQRLIQTPSVNPMGRDAVGSVYGESRLTDLLVRLCEQQGWRCLRKAVHPNRDNLLAVIEGFPVPHEGGELLLWDV